MSERTVDIVALLARALQAGHSVLSEDLSKKLLETAPGSATVLSLSASLHGSQ